jgi:hypothetical protein
MSSITEFVSSFENVMRRPWTALACEPLEQGEGAWRSDRHARCGVSTQMGTPDGAGGGKR